MQLKGTSVIGEVDHEALASMRFALETPNLAEIEIIKLYNATNGIDVDVKVTPINRDILSHTERLMIKFGNEEERELPENIYFSEQELSFQTAISLGNITTNTIFADTSSTIELTG